MSSIHKAVRETLAVWLSSVFPTFDTSTQSPAPTETIQFPDINLILKSVRRDPGDRMDVSHNGAIYTKLGDYSGDIVLELLCNNTASLESSESSLRKQWLVAADKYSECLRLVYDESGIDETIVLSWDGNMEYSNVLETAMQSIYRARCNMLLQIDLYMLRDSGTYGTIETANLAYDGETEVPIANN